MDDIQAQVFDLGDAAWQLVEKYGPSLVYALIVFIVGLWVIKMITRGVKRVIQKSEIDDSLTTFLSSLVSMILKVILVITVIDMVGIQATSFIAILGAAGLAVGMALSGTLQNFAGGVMILVFKPFKVGDYIDAQGHAGTVNQIQIFNTILKTPDNKTIIIPNGGLSTGSMVNYSTEETRRVDFTFGIGYSDDIDKAKGILNELVEKDSRILKDPAHMIAVSELADSSVNFVVRVWVNSGDYWGVHFDMIEAVKKAFDEKGVSIPFPQRDIHLFQEK
jgi:small conductance mechanosensitive channel